MGLNLPDIVGRIVLDRSGFSSGILEAQGLTRLLGQSFATFLANPLLGLANLASQAFGALKSGLMGVQESAEVMGKLSSATGASTEFLSGLKHAANMADVAFESVTDSFRFLARNAADAAAGTGPAAAAFARLGIAATNADGSLRGVDDLFMEAADKLGGMGNATERTALMLDIFGRGASGLAPLLAQGSEGIRAMIAEASDLGLTVGTEDAEAAERFGDSIKRLKAVFEGAFQKVAMPILEALAPVLELLGKLLKPVVDAIAFILKAVTAPLGWIADLIGGSSGGRAGGGTTVNVEVSTEDSADAVARKVAPAIAGGVRGVQSSIERSTRNRMDLHDYEQGLLLRD